MAYKYYPKYTIQREELVDVSKVPKETQEMLEIIQTTGHQNVVDLVLPKTMKKFKVFSSKLWTLVVPNNYEKVPVLMAHTDTVGNTKVNSFSWTQNKTAICNTVPKNIGGDDRLGCWIIKKLLEEENDNFAYILFDQEEVGCIGSYDFTRTKSMEYLEKIATVFIGLDRKGSSDLALYGYESAEFLEALETIPDYKEAYGSITDCAVLAEHAGICCVNFSVGYYNEHTANEYIVPSEAKKTLDTVRKLPKIFWEEVFKADYAFGGGSMYAGYYSANSGWGGYRSSYKPTNDTKLPTKYKTERRVTCDICQCEVDEVDTLYSTKGNLVCTSCVENDPFLADTEFSCESCGTTILASEGVFNAHGDFVCSNCFFTEQTYLDCGVWDEEEYKYQPSNVQKDTQFLWDDEDELDYSQLSKGINTSSYETTLTKISDTIVEELIKIKGDSSNVIYPLLIEDLKKVHEYKKSGMLNLEQLEEIELLEDMYNVK